MSDLSEKNLKKTFILPFATPASDRIRDFTKEMEMATVLYLAESNREKSEGNILKKPDERLAFITEAWYPIRLVPFDGATLLFDGLSVISHSVNYDTIPNIEIFNHDIHESKKTVEAYTATLQRNVEYFREFTGKEETVIEGFIRNPQLIEEFKNLLTQMKQTQKPPTTGLVLPTLIEDREIEEGVQQLSKLRMKIDEDIEDVNGSMKLLNATTTEITKEIRKEIEKTREEHNKQIAKLKPLLTRKILETQNKYHRKITSSSRRFESRLQSLRKNQTRLQKTLKHLNTKAKTFEARIESNKRRKKKQNETRWKLGLKSTKKKLPDLKKQLKETVKKTQEVEAIRKLETAQLKTECDVAIEETKNALRILEASKEAEIDAKRQGIAPLENTTFQITSQMRRMVEAKKAALAQLSAVTIRRRDQTQASAYLPFYLVRYEREDQKRYVIYPPSTVSGLGILTKMKGALGAAKMKTLLQPRSELTARFLNRFLALIERNPMLEKEITEASVHASILSARKLRIAVRKGLEELEKEDWMSEKEILAFSNILYIYA